LVRGQNKPARKLILVEIDPRDVLDMNIAMTVVEFSPWPCSETRCRKEEP